ncbi:MAG: choice-of-anchor J domain-containing protein [Bacteroidetes bacterium]|nr:choice-of-anchor J domain-containing protein [Bacteroidota bacterium]
MKKKFSFLFVFAFLIASIILGFSMSNTNDEKPNQRGANYKSSSSNGLISDINRNDPHDQRGPRSLSSTPPVVTQENDATYYTDDFDGANDTTALRSRGYHFFYNGGPIGVTACWYQGTTVVFNAYNGPATGYVAANYNATTGQNAIDNWLVLPKKNIAAGDFIKFYCRATTGNPFPDSLKVMYSAVGDSTAGGSWVQVGYFKAIDDGTWELKSFTAPSAGANARWAIRYFVIDGGPLGNNSNFIGIDALTLETPAGANDIATTAINTPNSSVVLPTSTIAPKATFQNVGSSGQTNIPVTFKITGPVNYTSNKVIASLSAGASTTVTFDSTFNPTVGSYNTTVYCSLGSDGNRTNDTLKSTFSAVDPNYGTQNGLSFANNFATGAPSKPTFCWKDTTGSKNIILNRVNVSSAPFVGSLDDGYWKIGGALNGKKIKMGGVSYDSFFVGTNGLVGFSDNSGLTSFSPSIASTIRPAIYPLWMDMDWRPPTTGGLGSCRLSYKVFNDYQLLISFDRAQEYNAGTADTNDHVSYQVIVELLDASSSQNSRMIVQVADTVGQKTGSKFLAYYNTDLLNAQVMGLQTAAGNAAYYRAAYPLTTYPGPLFGPGGTSLAVEYGSNANILNQACGLLNLTLTSSIEAMTPFSVGDTIMVRLRSTTSPYDVRDAAKGYMNGSGVANLSFYKIASGSYYIQVTHRNALETWSAAGVSGSAYNFTTSVGQAFGSNMVVVAGKASFYSGDVNQDGVIDLTDGALIDNDGLNFVTGYVNTDVNNDLVVDLTDGAYAENNAFNFVGVIRP